MSTSIKQNERGSARIKFLIALVVSVTVLYLGYMYVPIAVQAYEFKDLMQNKADAAATQGFDPSWVRDQLLKSLPDYGVPANAVITPTSREGRIEVRVQFTRPISFPGYTYEYEFDQTIKSSTFLTVR